MRGEDAGTARAFTEELETPPHAWGRRVVFARLIFTLGNTPTCVGKTAMEEMNRLAIRKHPHMRGEDTPCTSSGALVLETPPHAWGRRDPLCVGVPKIRNTPTCVGKTEGFILNKGFGPETPPHAWGRP